MSKSAGRFPRLVPEPDQTISGIGRALRDGRTSCVEILTGCLVQVEEWESKIHAWVVFDYGRALEQARRLDEELKNGKDHGPLHGIPIGIKDIIDVAGLPTACGAKRWADAIAGHDAEVVANLRAAGAVIMGKTVTTPYAWIDPPHTRNPWNLERTPGGSSSGSAAAVASGMCFGAIGTQTGGSITRPASFCGVVGMKPSKNTSEDTLFKGIKPFAPSLDHVGPIARSIEDARTIFLQMLGPNATAFATSIPLTSTPPRIGRLRGFFDRTADSAILPQIDAAVNALTAAGATVTDDENPLDFEAFIRDHRTIMAAEASIIHAGDVAKFPRDYPPRIRALIDEGLLLRGATIDPIEDRPSRSLDNRAFEPPALLAARERRRVAINEVSSALRKGKIDAWITPATIGGAPDTSTTGDPSFNSPWSFTGLPTLSFPIGLAQDGMPVALQLIGNTAQDFTLLRIAEWCEQAIQAQRQ